MGYFDFLIDSGLKPDSTKEYIIMMDIPLYEGSGFEQSGTLPEGSIVNNVQATKNSSERHTGYDFNVKGGDKIYHTNYPWVLALNSTENVEKINKYKAQSAIVEQAQVLQTHLRNQIETLAIKKEEHSDMDVVMGEK